MEATDTRIDLRQLQMTRTTKQRLLDSGTALLLKHGYSGLGIQAVLTATDTPKGSFSHHFKDKKDLALQVIDRYMREVHAGLDACLGDTERLPLERLRRFFEMTQEQYQNEGYMGCLLGGLGQELSGVSEVFRRKIEVCLSQMADRMAACLNEALRRGDIRADADVGLMASLLCNCWEVPRFAAGCSEMPRRWTRCSTSTSVRQSPSDVVTEAPSRNSCRGDRGLGDTAAGTGSAASPQSQRVRAARALEDHERASART